MREKKVRICFTSSSGGRLEQLLMLEPLVKKHGSYIVTEKLDYDAKTGNIPAKYVMQINRTGKPFFLKFICSIIKSFKIIVTNMPDVIISTGALAAVPLMIWTKISGGKVTYIESFAKIDPPNISGKIAYRFTDQFYIQWESIRKFYPKAICKGGIY